MKCIHDFLTHSAKICILIVIASVSVSCSSSKRASEHSGLPSWVNNPSSEFSDLRYLMAVGSGDNLADARADAMLNLAQIFRTRIDGTQNLYTEFAETTKNKTDFTSRETIRLMNNIRVGTNEELLNTEVLNSEVSKDGQYYVLAGMDRSASSRVYQQEIAKNYQKIDQNRASASQVQRTIRKLVLAKENVLLARVNENLNQQLAIIRPGTEDNSTALSVLDQTRREFDKIQAEALVRIRIANSTDLIRDAVSGVFQSEGFLITNENPVLMAEVTYSSQKTELNRDDAEFVIWNLSISIIDVENDVSYNTFSTEGRDGALSLNDAMKRAELNAAKEIETIFKQFLNSEVLSGN